MKHLKYLFILSMMFFVADCSQAQSSKKAEGEVVVLNKADFLTKVFNYEKNPNDWVYEGKKPCIIDFYADWCGPCKLIAPIMKELAAEYKDEIIFYKIDTDRERELASVFGITSIPLVLFVPVEGQPQALLGARPKDVFVEQIKLQLLEKKN
jgi:thioredoxin